MSRRAVLAGLGATMVPAHLRAEALPGNPWVDIAGHAEALDQLHSIIVIADGQERLATAIRGKGLDRTANIKSVSKSIMSLLVGAAMARGIIDGVDDTLGKLAPELIPPGADPRVAKISIGDLLTMRAGLERTSGPFYGPWVQSRNWVRYALARPFVAEPGERFQYSTGSYHVLGAVLARRAGTTLLALARAWLGAPLGIEIPAWTRDPQGYYMGGNNMGLTPRAMARIGEMVRHNGVFADTQVVPQDWVRTSLVPRTLSPFSGDLYGYGWFLASFGGEIGAYARGYGGQMIYVLPDAALTVVITSDPTRPARSDGYAGDLHRLVERIVLTLSAT